MIFGNLIQSENAKNLNSLDPLLVRDFDVLGAGSLIRWQLENQRKTKKISLEVHSKVFKSRFQSEYQKELNEFIEWIKPSEIIKNDQLTFEEIAHKSFCHIFPTSHNVLNESCKALWDEYFENVAWNSLLIADFWSYFPFFLKSKKKFSTEVYELVNWEWTQAWLKCQPNYRFKGDLGQILKSQCSQVLILSEANSFLKKKAGMYHIYFDAEIGELVTESADEVLAATFDLLYEDRKYSIQGLIDQIKLLCDAGKLSINEGQISYRLKQLIQKGVLVQLSEGPRGKLSESLVGE